MGILFGLVVGLLGLVELGLGGLVGLVRLESARGDAGLTAIEGILGNSGCVCVARGEEGARMIGVGGAKGL